VATQQQQQQQQKEKQASSESKGNSAATVAAAVPAIASLQTHLSPKQLASLAVLLGSGAVGADRDLVPGHDAERIVQRFVAQSSSAGPAFMIPLNWQRMSFGDVQNLIDLFALSRSMRAAAANDPKRFGLQQQSSSLSDKADHIDWREFIINLSLPIGVSVPSMQQLINMLALFQRNDTDQDGFVSAAEFMAVPLWFESSSAFVPSSSVALSSSAKKASSLSAAQRMLQSLKQLYFQLFSRAVQVANPAHGAGNMAEEDEKQHDETSDEFALGPAKLTVAAVDYRLFLLYFCYDSAGAASATATADDGGAAKVNMVAQHGFQSAAMQRVLRRQDRFYRRDIESLFPLNR
jgi:Ca2+-binding EF-hand superfamily protein